MGAGSSIPDSVAEAKVLGFTQTEIEAYLQKTSKRRSSSFDLSGVYLAKLTPPSSPKIQPQPGKALIAVELQEEKFGGEGEAKLVHEHK